MSTIILNSLNNNYQIDDILLHKYENVLSYKYAHCKSEITINLALPESALPESAVTLPENKNIYYVLDCFGDDALFHWIAECFIFNPILLKIQILYPNIKILTSNKKKYVKSMLKFFNINFDIIYNIETTNNICFFSPTISLNDLSSDYDINIYKKYINLYINNINLLLSNSHLINNNILLLPRNSKDNYVGNDRVIPGIDDIEQNIIDIGGVVLNTYQLNNIYIQFSIIKQSEIIIVDYGSSLFFNCLFVSNKTIIILDNFRLDNVRLGHIGLGIIYDIINKNNKVIMVNSNNNNIIEYNNIKEFL